MIKFLDGPAEDCTLMLRRAPMFLRVVIDGTGEVDALDQLEDEPQPNETIYAYEIVGEPGRMHLNARGTKASGWYMVGEYKMVEDQPPEPVMRDNSLWGRWAESEGRRRQS